MSEASFNWDDIPTPDGDSDLEQHTLSDISDSDSDNQSILTPNFLQLHEFRNNSSLHSITPPILHKFSESPINSEQTTPPNLQRGGLQSDSQPEELPPIPPLNLSDTDTTFPNISNSTHQNLVSNMNKLAKCRDFNGYPQDNAKQFLAEFESYSILNELHLSDKRKIAAFHLQLRGPALSWFSALSDEAKRSWDTIVVLFKEKYVNFNWQCSKAMMESELFHNITLQPGQNIEDYFSSIVDKGQLLQKPEHEIMAKFIAGLPNKMAFFVRAGHPTDTQTALTSAKMAEACGYRDHSESVNAIDSARKQKPYQKIQGTTDPAVEDLRKQIENLTEIVTKQEKPSASVSASSQSEIDVLKAQVKTLTDLVLSRNDNKRHAPPPKKIDTPQFDKKIECFHCKGLGHTRTYCNWIGVGTTTNTVCQLCQQNGHEALACKVLIAYQPGN